MLSSSNLLTRYPSSHRSYSPDTRLEEKYPQSPFSTSKIPSFYRVLSLRSWLSSSSIGLGRYGRSVHHVSPSNTAIWKYSRVTFISILLIWSMYCMIRYFLSLAVYDHDPLRSHFAIAMGTLSALAVLSFGSETSMVYALAMQLHIDRKLRNFIHSLTYISSLLLIIPAIVNIVIVIEWRKPESFQDFDRVIQGRCNWDVDAIWTGTGMSCSAKDAQSFGVWLGASIFRFVFTLIVVALYFFASRYFPRPDEEPMPLPMEAGSQMDELTTDVFQPPDIVQTSLPEERVVYSPKHRKGFSFSDAGEVLSRLEKPRVGDADDDEDSDGGHTVTDSTYARVLTDEPDYLPGSSSLQSRLSSSSSRRLSSKGSIQGPRPKPSLGGSKSSSKTSTSPIDSPSQEVASQLQSILDEVERDTEAAMLHHSSFQSNRPSVHIFGKTFDKLSIIESEEADSPLLYSPTTSHSSHRYPG